jgi:hypothetical protein
MLSIYTRHHPDCKNAGDKSWRRCSCPKWIWGSLNGTFVRKSAKTHDWEVAEQLRLSLTAEADLPGIPALPSADLHSPHALVIQITAPAPPAPPADIIPSPPQKARITIERAVDAYLTDARSRGLEESTLSKLETIFRKQFLYWSRIEGFEHVDQLDLDALLCFRSTWIDGALAKQKKQSRFIGFSGLAYAAATSSKIQP